MNKPLDQHVTLCNPGGIATRSGSEIWACDDDDHDATPFSVSPLALLGLSHRQLRWTCLP
ncbi:hypothetical protein RSAG8_09221, partial [Rhizoctonia solani AG-8 WAC10335]